jgi:hypothetical protein
MTENTPIVNIKNIVKWFDSTLTENNLTATYDNSSVQKNNIQALTGDYRLNYNNTEKLDQRGRLIS